MATTFHSDIPVFQIILDRCKAGHFVAVDVARIDGTAHAFDPSTYHSSHLFAYHDYKCRVAIRCWAVADSDMSSDDALPAVQAEFGQRPKRTLNLDTFESRLIYAPNEQILSCLDRIWAECE